MDNPASSFHKNTTRDARNGYYYRSGVTQLRKIDQLKLKLEDCNYVKYSTYRVALKLHVLQENTYMQGVPLSMVEGVFERHKLQTNESSLCLESSELEAVIYDIFFAVNKQNNTQFDVDDATDQMLDLLCCIFAKNPKCSIQVASAKLVLGLLSSCNLRQFYNFLFGLCSDHNNCVSRLRLQSVLTKLTEVLMFLEEDVMFGKHLVNSSVEYCFVNSPGLVGINEASFMLWLDKQPQLLSWAPVLDKIKTTHSVVHAVKCSSCKNTPLSGLIYKCMKCTKYIQCQNCFFVGRISHSHKLSHSMKEYSSEKTSQNGSHNIVKRLLRLLGCSIKSSDQAISVAKMHSLRNSYKQYFVKCLAPNFCDIGHLPLQHQLQVIIQQLELQSRHLQMMIHSNHNDAEMIKYLDDHRMHMALQVRRLRMLKNNLRLTEQPPPVDSEDHLKNSQESTPKTRSSHQNLDTINLDLLSPILQPDQHQSDTFFTCSGSLDQETRVSESKVSYITQDASGPYKYQDISSWIGGHHPLSFKSSPDTGQDLRLTKQSQVNGLHTDLDDALAKLQQILANNFSFDEASMDNGKLKYAVSEVEDVLTSFIDTVESSTTNSFNSNITQ